MSDTIILLGNPHPLELFKTVTDDSADVRRIKAAAADTDDVRVSEVEYPHPDDVDLAEDHPEKRRVKRHLVEVHRPRPDLVGAECRMSIPEGWGDDEVIKAVKDLWAQQALEPASWVEVEGDPHLAETIARIFRKDGNECPIGRPAEEQA